MFLMLRRISFIMSTYLLTNCSGNYIGAKVMAGHCMALEVCRLDCCTEAPRRTLLTITAWPCACHSIMRAMERSVILGLDSNVRLGQPHRGEYPSVFRIDSSLRTS